MMTENIDKPQGGDTDKPQGGTNGQAQGASETMATSDPSLLLKIAELEKDNKKYRDERKAQEAATKKAQEEQLAAQQKWQELAESRGAELDKLKPVAEQFEVITAAFNETLEGQLKDIPNDVRKSIVDPARETMSPVAFSKWLREFVAKFPGPKAPPLDGGAGSERVTGTVVELSADQKEMADLAGMSHKEYWDALQRTKQTGEISWARKPKE